MIYEEKLIQYALAGHYDQLRSHGVTPEYFADLSLRLAWQCITAIGDTGQTVDKQLVIAHLEDQGFNASRMAKIEPQHPQGNDFKNFLTIAQKSHDRRMWTRQLKEASEQLTNSNDPANLLGSLANRIIENQMSMVDQGRSASEAINEWGDWIQANKDMDPAKTLTSGIRGIDDLHGRFQPGRLYVVAARPGAGKSALCHYLIYRMIKEGHRVGIFSMEMSKVEILSRLVAMESGVNSYFQDFPNEASDAQLSAISEAAKRIGGDIGSRLFLSDQSSLSVYQAKAIARGWVYSKRVEAIFVDYLQLMKATSRSNDGRAKDVAEVAEGLKEIARELGVPVIAPAQASRQYEIEGRKPRLSDLGESSGIEKAADSVAFLIEGQTNQGQDYLEYYLAKQRAGRVGSAYLEFQKPITTFRDIQ